MALIRRLNAALAILLLAAEVMGSFLHLWTAYVGYVQAGIKGLILSLFLPVLSEIYWFLHFQAIFGTFGNPYTLAVFIEAATLAAFVLVGVVTVRLEEERDVRAAKLSG
jgi:chromate transport protein ChrA